ncbi:MAG: CoA-binding protein [candidate division NC10 bacterium]|nr:CoA-binding protein [candidate division NC10 bacterium]
MAILADEKTRIIVQGITGREAASFTKDSLDYGARIVAGVTPGKGGRSIHGVPVYDTVEQALEEHPADASVISVPPAFVKDAAYEALLNGVRLLVIVTERAPRRDVAEIVALAREKEATIVGPNSLGLISPGKTKVGMVGGPAADVRKAYMPGPVGIVSRSGGMTTEIANLLTQNSIGQSTAISIGGDPLVGSTFCDLIPLFEKDSETKAVVVFAEPGGTMEERLAEYITATHPKLPIIAFVAGRFVDEMPGVRFGHAAVIVEGDRGRTKEKIRLFQEAGIVVAQEFSEIAELVKTVVRDRDS